MREEAEYPQAIVGLDDDDAFLGQSFAVIALFGVATGNEAASVEPDEYRQPRFAFAGRRPPNGEVQAVFARLRVTHELQDVPEDVGLHTSRAEFVGGPNTRPFRGGPRSPPAQLPDRRRGKGHALEHENGMIGVVGAFQLAGFGGDLLGGTRERSGKRQERSQPREVPSRTGEWTHGVSRKSALQCITTGNSTKTAGAREERGQPVERKSFACPAVPPEDGTLP